MPETAGNGQGVPEEAAQKTGAKDAGKANEREKREKREKRDRERRRDSRKEETL